MIGDPPTRPGSMPRRQPFPLALLVLGLLSACARAPSGPPPAAHTANEVLFLALSLVGTPYRYGGNTPEGGFDCSGLIGYVFRQAAGATLPRSTGELARLPGAAIGRALLRSGDLVLFGRRGRTDHAGIYVGDGRFVHAPSSGGTVRLDALDDAYWQPRFISGKRVL